MLAFDSVAVLQTFCLVTLVLIMFDVDEENIFQNDRLCCFIVPFFFSYAPSGLLARIRNCSPFLIIFRKKTVAGKCHFLSRAARSSVRFNFL